MVRFMIGGITLYFLFIVSLATDLSFVSDTGCMGQDFPDVISNEQKPVRIHLPPFPPPNIAPPIFRGHLTREAIGIEGCIKLNGYLPHRHLRPFGLPRVNYPDKLPATPTRIPFPALRAICEGCSRRGRPRTLCEIAPRNRSQKPSPRSHSLCSCLRMRFRPPSCRDAHTTRERRSLHGR